MKQRPILFSAPMVRALLDGTKTQTRRVVKQRKDSYMGVMLAPNEIAGEINSGDYSNSPYGQPGDQLWVRETWGYRMTIWASTDWLSGNHLIEYAANNEKIIYPRPDKNGLPKRRNKRDDEDSLTYINYLKKYFAQWRPSIFMPRWASRITLEITSVRVERLQDITAADALAEGIKIHEKFINRNDHYGPIAAYRDLWGSINGAGSWDLNPWVWVIEFKKI